MDYDYLHKLSAEEKKWLQQFNDEYYLGNFAKPRPLHKKKKQIEEIKEDRYARDSNVPIQLSERAYPEDPHHLSQTSPEDAYIEYLDSRNKKKK